MPARFEFGRFLGAAAENEGIAALQPHHGPAGPAEPHQHVVDLFLRHRMEARLLADIDAGRAVPDRGEDAVRHEAIVHDDLSLPDYPRRLQGEQFRIARARSDQVDFSNAHCALRPVSAGAFWLLIQAARQARLPHRLVVFNVVSRRRYAC